MSMLRFFNVGLRKAETKKLVEEAREKGMHPDKRAAQIIREHYGVSEE